MSEDSEQHQVETKDGKTLTIREARSDTDYYAAYPVILQLIPTLDMQTYAQRVFVARATGYRMFVAEIDGGVVGVIGIIHNHNLHDGFITYIEQVVVDLAYRGHGYGSLLVQFAERRAREEGCDMVALDVDDGETKTENFYLRNHYKISGKYMYKDISRNE